MQSSPPGKFPIRTHSRQTVSATLSACAFPPFPHFSLVINDVEFLRERENYAQYKKWLKKLITESLAPVGSFYCYKVIIQVDIYLASVAFFYGTQSNLRQKKKGTRVQASYF